MGRDPVVQGVELPFISPGEISQPPRGRSREDRVGQGSRQSRSLVEGATWSLAEHV